jgi:chromosomal replication initiator protein
MDGQKLWKLVLEDVQTTISKGAYSSWIKTLALAQTTPIPPNRLIADLSCSSAFHQKIIEERFYGQLKEAFDRISELQVELRLTIQHTNTTATPEAGPLFAATTHTSNQDIDLMIHRYGLREDYVFDTYAVSPSNEVAYAASQAVADNLGKAYNPLFLYGDVGVGKTHLMQAIAINALQHDPQIKMIYCAGEQFTNEIIEAIQQKNTQSFRQRYRKVKGLFIDDIQFIAGKNTVQEEFFHTFNAIHQAGGQIVLTSDRSPSEIKALEDRLRSRFEAGLIVDIGQPNFELRSAIVLIKAKQFSLPIAMEEAQLIAANVESARQIEGFLVRLRTQAQLKKQPITSSFIQSLLNIKVSSPNSPPPLRPIEIVRGVARHFELTTKDIQGKGRSRRLVTPRHIAMYLLRVDYGLPLEEVGGLFSHRDHTTVMHAVDKIGQELRDKESLRLDLTTLRDVLYKSVG